MPQVPPSLLRPFLTSLDAETDRSGPFFPRRQLAREIAGDLMSRPRESGLLLTGPRRTGKTTFVKEDLLPVLRAEHDVHVLHIDLAAYRHAEPGLAILHALRRELQRFDGVVLRAARSLGLTNVRLGGLEMNVAQAQALYAEGVLDVMRALLRKVGKRLVIVMDEVQRSQQTAHGRDVLYALMRGSDHLNIERGPGVRVVATGSHTHKLRKLTSSKDEAFFDATVRDLPQLGSDFICWLRQQWPSLGRLDAELMTRGFDLLLHRPRELVDVCRQLSAMVIRSPGAVEQLFQLLVDDQAANGKEEFVQSLRTLSDLELALLRVMAETGPRFAPHHRWCRQRVAALMVVMVDLPLSPELSRDEIDAALQGLEDRRLIWRGLGFAFENQRAADWLLTLDPSTDFRVDHDELPRLAARSGAASFPTLAA